ncbi:CopD family protein [Uliginosibacterium flavum]|uniref:Protoporphyrinogen IX oxidase n=1 Tax=Uliginosibacterium flavum TaxID=1396831 RepID=A0ABV2TSV7_9RHOO
MLYLWLKALHVFFVVSWFAALFYLPRIYVNLAAVPAENTAEYDRLLGMAQRLKRFSIPLHIGVWVCGLTLTIDSLGGISAWWAQGWLHVKLLLVLCLSGYDGWCTRLLRDFIARRNTRSHVWYRWFNEVPVFFLIAILILVIVKPL